MKRYPYPIYEQGDYWITKAKAFKGYEIYKTGITHSTRRGIIGFEGEKGFVRAKQEIDRLITRDQSC